MKRKTYEYYCVVVSSNDLSNKLNEMGQMGYRAISIQIGGKNGIFIVFELEVEP